MDDLSLDEGGRGWSEVRENPGGFLRCALSNLGHPKQEPKPKSVPSAPSRSHWLTISGSRPDLRHPTVLEGDVAAAKLLAAELS